MDEMVRETLALEDRLELASQETLEAILMQGHDQVLVNSQRGIALTLPRSFTVTLTEFLTNLYVSASAGAVTSVQKALKTELKAVSLENLALEYIDNYGAMKIAQIIRATENMTQNYLLRSLRNGASIEDAMRAFSEDVVNIAQARAQTILRTELHAIVQFASQKSVERSGLLVKKVWRTIKDQNTRRFGVLGRQDAFDHLVMDGETVPLPHNFLVPHRTGTFEPLLFPGDPLGSAGNIINCRCRQVYLKVT